MDQGFANLVLRKNLHDVDSKDKGLITEIVYGTLRNNRLLKAQYEEFVYKQLPQEVDIILMMSSYQMFFMDKIPIYAIVNEAVDLAKGEFRSVVNAILRKLSNRGLIEVVREDDLTTLGVNTSFPDWIIRMWNAHYGLETTKKIAYEFTKEAIVYGRINTILISKDELSKDNRVRFIDDVCFVFDGNIVESDYFKIADTINFSKNEELKFAKLFFDNNLNKINGDVVIYNDDGISIQPDIGTAIFLKYFGKDKATISISGFADSLKVKKGNIPCLRFESKAYKLLENNKKFQKIKKIIESKADDRVYL